VKTGTATAAGVTGTSGGSNTEVQGSAATGVSQSSSDGNVKAFVSGMILSVSGAMFGLTVLVL
jgi:hypothetical protein